MKRFLDRRTILAVAVLILAPLLWFAPVILGGKTLIPADNLYQFQPWASLAGQYGVGVPHNELLSDLVLENFVWKSFLREAISTGQLPLWNPHLFTGVPFLAAGQHSALYPLSIVFYILPLPLAYGVFTWLQLAVAALGMYVFGRALRLGRAASAFAGLAYAFSGFFVVSVVFTMIIAAAAWLPWLLACIETIVRKQEEKGDVAYSPIPYVLGGAVVLGLQALAGHPEIVVITLLVAGFYSLLRLLVLWRRIGALGRAARLAGWLLVLVVIGIALGAIQIVPLFELVSTSFREGSASYDQVVGWAWPVRQLITFLLPDFFGNPSHHGWFDPYVGAWRAAGPNAAGQPVRDVFWGVKNYVEGGNYLGVMTLALAGVAVVYAAAQAIFGRKRREGSEGKAGKEGKAENQALHPPSAARHPLPAPQLWILAALALMSLLFAFGTPLYAVLFYGVPGYKQLHSAFRWVFPYTLAMTALAGFGMQIVLNRLRAGGTGGRGRSIVRVLGGVLFLAGAATLLAALLSLLVPDPFFAVGQRIVDSSDLARNVFANGRDFWSYQWRHVLHLGLLGLLTGGWLLLAARDGSRAPRQQRQLRWSVILPAAAAAILMLDLFLVLGNFNPASDPDLLQVTPPSVAFLQDDPSLFRVTTFEGEGTSKTLNANTPWMAGLQDVRGYDSIIPRQYVQYMQAIEPQGQLLYNRISPFYDPASLDDPLTDLLGVKYVVSELPLDVPGWQLVYDDEVKIYQNEDVFPRAFIAGEAQLADEAAVLDRLRQVDLRETVVLEATAEPVRGENSAPTRSGFPRAALEYAGQLPASELPPPASPELRTAEISRYGMRDVYVDVNVSDRGWLVLADAWFPGWKAYIRPFGVTGEGVDAEGNPLETELPVFRADGNFRAVYLPEAGQWTVRFVYSPRSVQVGVYATFLAVISLILLGGWWAWGKFYRDVDDEHAAVRTVAKNTSVQMFLSLLNRAIDFAFAMLRLRVLGPAGEGSYAFVIAIYGFFEVVVRFGLGTLLTRDVAQEKGQAGRYLTNVLALRLLLWLASIPILLVVMGIYARGGSLSPAEAQALVLFQVSLFFATLSDSFSAVFMAYEKMEYPAGVSSAIATGKVALGALVLLPPFNLGFVGLAAVSLIMNIIQAAWLWIVLRRTIPIHLTRPDWLLQRSMAIQAYPLMLNHLLASIFWRIDMWLLKPLAGAAAVGIYSAGVKYLDGFNVIPSYFTLAIFPLMSRYARDSHDSLIRAYHLAIRLLVMIALPIAVLVTLLSTLLIRILGGSAFLPDSAIALTILIWSIPIGFVNSVTQYVLIAVNQQRFLTRAFIIGVLFNIGANLVLIPRYGYAGAAVVTVLSEVSLLIPFYIAVRRHVARLPWVELLWRQLVAAAGMGATAALLRNTELVAVVLSSLVYVGLLVALGAFRDPDIQRVLRIVPFIGQRVPAAPSDPFGE
ncbi:MAG: polysaccharide biosynthesis C-terminal domain-containing protein [Caldilineae bacterium]|nr:polysaccharide biosynthesis C-terminal domain-containing protein [Caldilineae bacterium]